MIFRSDTVLDSFGRPVEGASIYVKTFDGTDATLTSDGTSALAQPIPTDEFGGYGYYADTGYYSEEVWFGGKLRWVEHNIAIGNPGADLALRSDLAASGGYALVNRRPAGAAGNGTTDDTAAITAFDAVSGRKYLYTGTYLTTLGVTALNGPFNGDGQIKTADGNKRAPWFTAIKSRPTLLGDRNLIDTAFNGDLSHVLLPVEHRITGTATLGTPTTGYLFTPETAAIFGVSRNESGHNESTSTNDGRTSANYAFVKIENYGQGDHAAYTIAGFVQGSRSGATDFLANPAISALNGTFTAGADAVYLDSIEVDLQLGTFDAAAVGHITSITRNTGDTANGKGAFAGGYRVQSKGTYPVDWAVSASGKMKTLTDGTQCDFGTNKAAHVIKGADRIYLNGSSTDGRRATSLGTEWLERSANGIDIAYGGAAVLRTTSAGYGYASGNGGGVVQLTSKSTAVTLNKVCGQITLSNAALAANTVVTFTLNNSNIAADDDVRVWVKSGNATPGTYRVAAEGNGAGTRTIVVENKTAGSLSEALILGVNVLKAAVS